MRTLLKKRALVIQIKNPKDGEELQKLKEETNTFFFEKTNFKFLNEHFGLRPYMIHLLIGYSGKGKSTLSRSIASQTAIKEKIIYYSTEESLDQASKGFPLVNGISVVKNIDFIHEIECCDKYKNFNVDLMEKLISAHLAEFNSKILFFDNPTAGLLAFSQENQFKYQLEIAGMLKRLSARGVTIFCVAHTVADSKRETMLTTDSLKGAKALSSLAEYFYAFYNINYQFEGEDKVFSCINVLKSREHENSGRFYKLNYDFENRTYTHDISIKFNSFLEIFKKRQKLV